MNKTVPKDKQTKKPAYRRPSLMLLLRSLLFGALGLVLAPVLVMFSVLTLARIFDPRCGTPGDSGGCEMGSFSIGIAAAIPGFSFFFFVTLIRGMRKQARQSAAKFTLDT